MNLSKVVFLLFIYVKELIFGTFEVSLSPKEYLNNFNKSLKYQPKTKKSEEFFSDKLATEEKSTQEFSDGSSSDSLYMMSKAKGNKFDLNALKENDQENLSKDFCFSSHIQIDCTLSIIVVVLAVITILLNTFSTVMVFRATHYFFTFEQYVLYSAMVENIIIIVSVFTMSIFLIQLVHFLQMIVVIFITRRFLKIYKSFERIEHSLHNTYYLIFIILNILLFAIILVTTIIDTIGDKDVESQKWFDVFVVVTRGFAFVCTAVQFKVGRDVANILNNEAEEMKAKFYEVTSPQGHRSEESNNKSKETKDTVSSRKKVPTEDGNEIHESLDGTKVMRNRGRINSAESADKRNSQKTDESRGESMNSKSSFFSVHQQEKGQRKYSREENRSRNKGATEIDLEAEVPGNHKYSEDMFQGDYLDSINVHMNNHEDEYVRLRILQVYFIILPACLIYFVLFIISFVRYFFIDDDLHVTDWHVTALTTGGATVIFFYKILLIIPGIYNFTAFYFLIRESYRTQYYSKSNKFKSHHIKEEEIAYDEENHEDSHCRLTLSQEVVTPKDRNFEEFNHRPSNLKKQGHDVYSVEKNYNDNEPQQHNVYQERNDSTKDLRYLSEGEGRSLSPKISNKSKRLSTKISKDISDYLNM